LLKKIRRAIDRQPGIGRPRSVCQRQHWVCRRPCAQSGRQSKNEPIESWDLLWNWHSLCHFNFWLSLSLSETL